MTNMWGQPRFVKVNNFDEWYDKDFTRNYYYLDWDKIIRYIAGCGFKGIELMWFATSVIPAMFGSFENFKQLFIKQAATLFGSGWLWLVEDKDGKLSLMQTSNAETPLTHEGLKPLLTCDVWEHAYYLDQQNLRLAYLNEFWQVINWQFVEKNM